MDEYDAKQRFDQVFSLPARPHTRYAGGHLLCVDQATGLAAPASDAPGLAVLGVVYRGFDPNRLRDGNSDGLVTYTTGTYRFLNSASHPITRSWYGKPVFVDCNDITVGVNPGSNNVIVGFFRGFDQQAGFVWVDTRAIPLLAAFFGNNPQSNFRLSANAAGGLIFQLWNQDQALYQTIQLAGAPNQEHLVIA